MRAFRFLLPKARILSPAMSSRSAPKPTIPCLTAINAADLDADLYRKTHFSVDQLMELAGLAVAQAVYRAFPLKHQPDTEESGQVDQQAKEEGRSSDKPGAKGLAPDSPAHRDGGEGGKVLLVCGPGNNGGDGLVAARHLLHFGYQPKVYYPKPNKADLFQRLLVQLDHLDIPLVQTEEFETEMERANFVVDAVFGFGFAPGTVREPFKSVIKQLAQTSTPIFSIDIPSGWHVDNGPSGEPEMTIRPEALISLTAPKSFISHFERGRHYLGGRFLPPWLAKKYGLLDLPRFPGTDQIVETAVPIKGVVAPDPTQDDRNDKDETRTEERKGAL